MLSIGKLVAGAENYYLKSVAKGAEEYYLGAGEAPGRWVGSGCPVLGLSGLVGAAELRQLLSGFSPAGERITTAPLGAKRVAGFDLCFSAPKSVSVLWGLSGDELSRPVRSAHDAAVEEALGYLERHALAARRGAGGERRIATAGLVAGAFRHRTSRAGDPQLHTHVLMANAVYATDGRWSAPDARLLYFHARAAGALYQAALRAGLAESLGLRFGPVCHGSAEVAGVDRALLRLFSTRREQVETAMEHHGAHSRKAAEVAALATRPAKEHALLDASGRRSLRELWQERAVEAGIEPAQMTKVAGAPRTVHPGGQETDALVEHLLGSEGLTAQASTFERRDVVREVAEAMESGAHARFVEEIATAVLEREEARFLDVGGHGGEGIWSTRELLDIERRLLAEGEHQLGQERAVLDSRAVDALLAVHDELTPEQAQLVRRLLTSGDGIEVVVGKAGSGKTQAFAAARQGWEAAGCTMVGAALSARAAAELEAATGIASDTVAGLLARVGHGERVLAGTGVVVVDEAGMVGTRELWRLVQAASSSATKVVLVGDHRQLPEISAGGAYGALVGRLDGALLRANHRQRQAWERTALDELRAGDVAAALERYQARGRLQLFSTMAEARAAMVERWLLSREEGPVVMLAVRRADVEELNALAREALRQRGELGADVVAAAGRGFAVDDEVICLKNDRALGVKNGTRATVVGAVDRGVLIAGAEGERRLDASYLEAGHLAHGYATTIHKAQGATVERAVVLGSAGLYREAGYVAMSRARARSDLYVVEGSLDAELGRAEGYDPLDDLARDLSTSRAKHLASTHLREADKVPAHHPRAADAIDHPGPEHGKRFLAGRGIGR